MTSRVQPKWLTMEEISTLLGTPLLRPTRGSSIPQTFFADIASEMGIPQQSSMPAMARSIIERANLDWLPEFSSEHTTSGGGSTVTALGLLQVKNAVLIWLNKKPIPLPTIKFNAIREEWTPSADWETLRENLPSELKSVVTRPGASSFRKLVLNEYNETCAVSGFKSIEVIDVAHIVPYYGIESDDIQNAIALRTDLHRLFDQGLLLIDFDKNLDTYITKIHKSVTEDYGQFDTISINLPQDLDSLPSKSALQIRKNMFSKEWPT